MAPTKQGNARIATARELRAARRRVEQATMQEARVRQMFNVCTSNDERARLLQELRAVSELRKESVSQYEALQALFECVDN